MLSANPIWKPETAMPVDRRWFSPPLYGMPNWADLFTDRQLAALNTFSDLVGMKRANASTSTRSPPGCRTTAFPYARAELGRLRMLRRWVCIWEYA